MDQTSACDVWSFGMIMYCLLFGKKPKSFYSIYRDWLKRCHGLDTQNLSLPFTPPSQSNFLYDPFSIDFEKPFDSSEDLQAAGFD
jgi:serine/threonine protein kinase